MYLHVYHTKTTSHVGTYAIHPWKSVMGFGGFFPDSQDAGERGLNTRVFDGIPELPGGHCCWEGAINGYITYKWFHVSIIQFG